VRRPLGVVDIVYARRGDVSQRALAAQTDGFEHIDPLLGTEESSLVRHRMIRLVSKGATFRIFWFRDLVKPEELAGAVGD